MMVTPFPRLPFVSRPTRTTVDLLGADGSLLQVHVVFSWWHLGQRSFRQLSFAICLTYPLLNTTNLTVIRDSIFPNSSSIIALARS